ncbi:hypothetical protein GNF86_25495, partial [Clostridium perfringens]
TEHKQRYLVDKTPPEGDVYIENITTTGFDVVVKNISDKHSGVEKVTLESKSSDGISKSQDKVITEGKNTVNFRVNTSDYENECGDYDLKIVISDKVENEKEINKTVYVPFPKPIVSPIEIINSK